MDSKQRRWSEDVKDFLLLFKYALNLIKYSPAISPHVFLVLLTEIKYLKVNLWVFGCKITVHKTKWKLDVKKCSKTKALEKSQNGKDICIRNAKNIIF